MSLFTAAQHLSVLWQHGGTCIACRDCNPHLEGTGPFTLQANLSQQGFYQLCSTDCRITFLRKWIQAHLQECARIGAIRAPLLMRSPSLSMP